MTELLQQLMADTRDVSLRPFAPELAICATIVVLLLIRLFDGLRWLTAFWPTLIGASVALALTIPWSAMGNAASVSEALANVGRTEIFTGMLVYDPFSIFIRAFLLIFAILFVLFTRLSGVPDREDATDFYALFLGATLGMCLMASANHLLMVFLAVEMASVPSYVLAGSLRRAKSSEAALKYAVYGAGAAGVMVYGISLLAGVLQSAHLPTMAFQLAAKFQGGGMQDGELPVLVLGGLMVMVGLCFKLSAVPFHFWAPDVFEGSAAEVGAFLSVASKAAALALLVRVALGLAIVPEGYEKPTPASNTAVAHLAPSESGLMSLADAPTAKVEAEGNAVAAVHAPGEAIGDAAKNAALAPARTFIAMLIALIAAITCTFGNLAAYAQTNIKRLLAYSTIAHAGYMMMALPPAILLAGYDPAAGRVAIGALTLYLAIYLFMNLGAFAVVAFLRNKIGSEDIADYAGLIRSCPGVVICLSLILFSLVGLPPLAGFLGKFAVFAALMDGYRASTAANVPATFLLVLLIIGGLNTAISLFYYLRVVKVMTIDPEPENRVPVSFPLVSLSGAFLAAITAPIVFLIISWDGINELARAAAESLM